MKQFLALIFLLRVLYWLVVTILKCFGVIKVQEAPAEGEQLPNESLEAVQQPEIIPDQTPDTADTQTKKKQNQKKKKTKSKVTKVEKQEEKYQVLQQEALKPQQAVQPPQGKPQNALQPNQKQQQQPQQQKEKAQPQQNQQKQQFQNQRVIMVDAQTQTVFDIDDLQQKINMLEELTRKTILQEIAYKKQVIGKISDEIFKNPLLQQLQSDLDNGQIPAHLLPDKLPSSLPSSYLSDKDLPQSATKPLVKGANKNKKKKK